MSNVTTPSTSDDIRSDEVSARVKRRPIPRKGHKKSRGGCLTCKRRKVKCDEVAPLCGACKRLGMECTFATKMRVREDDAASGQLVLKPALNTDPAWFTLDDMRFFQHFLFAAYPSLPLDGQVIWQDISQMAHEYDFLLHGMLGLGASHLSLVLPTGYAEAALKHRIIALKGFKEFISNAHLSAANADAAFATALVLTFQATQMRDGVNDFLTMVRGCHLIGQHLVDFDSSRFSTLDREAYIGKLKDLVPFDRPIPHFDPTIVDGFVKSLDAIVPFCRSIKELQFLATMRRIATEAQRDTKCGYFEHTRIYEVLSLLDSDEFASFISESNYTGRLLVMHMLVLDFAMGSTLLEHRRHGVSPALPQNAFDYIKVMLLSWTEKISERLPPEYKRYGSWTVAFARSCCQSGKELPPGGGDSYNYIGVTLRDLVL